MTTKERPILFSAPMVRAILAGRKTQTRRVMKHPEYFGCLTGDCPHEKQIECDNAISLFAKMDCPHGQPGDRLWVRETWRPQDGMTLECQYADEIEYRATDDQPKEPTDCHWKPSIYMPRWASRITLEIVGVRVERVQDIGEEDAMAEGVTDLGGVWQSPQKTSRSRNGGCICGSARLAYEELWDSLNAARGYGWEKNPWVWVIEFKRIKP